MRVYRNVTPLFYRKQSVKNYIPQYVPSQNSGNLRTYYISLLTKQPVLKLNSVRRAVFSAKILKIFLL